jgi:hypothetical protein
LPARAFITLPPTLDHLTSLRLRAARRCWRTTTGTSASRLPSPKPRPRLAWRRGHALAGSRLGGIGKGRPGSARRTDDDGVEDFVRLNGGSPRGDGSRKMITVKIKILS